MNTHNDCEATSEEDPGANFVCRDCGSEVYRPIKQQGEPDVCYTCRYLATLPPEVQEATGLLLLLTQREPSQHSQAARRD